jgi:hypothetical protein
MVALRIFYLAYHLMGMANELLKIWNIKFWYEIDHEYANTLHMQAFMSQQSHTWLRCEFFNLCTTNFM